MFLVVRDLTSSVIIAEFEKKVMHRKSNYLAISKQMEARTSALRNHQQFSIVYLTIRRHIRRQDLDFEYFADQLIPLSVVTVSIHRNQQAAFI